MGDIVIAAAVAFILGAISGGVLVAPVLVVTFNWWTTRRTEDDHTNE